MSSFPAELSRRRSCIRARWHSAGISAAGGALKALLRLYQLPCKSQEGAVEWAGGRQRGSLVTWCWEVMCCRAELWGGRRSGQGSPGSERSGETEGFRMGLILAKLWSLFGNEGKPWFQQEFTSDLNLSLSLCQNTRFAWLVSITQGKQQFSINSWWTRWFTRHPPSAAMWRRWELPRPCVQGFSMFIFSLNRLCGITSILLCGTWEDKSR